MPDNPSNPFQFWQELKRRKVVRVIIVYAAASFVILELVSNIKEPLLLPDWTDRESHIGRLDRGLDEAYERGWTVIDMKEDWKVIYPFELAE